ncbi:MAG: DMT family transporter, partial [Alphaproteobacteria bacterium]|nr:DMT family transporter [Alphaproteobacteria bacterium]
MTTQSSTVDRLALVSLLGGAAAIAFAPIFVRLSELGPSATAFHRLFLALPFLWIWMARQPRSARPVGRRDYLALTAAGLFFAADLAVWHWSIKFTSVANSTLLANFAPVFVTFAAWALFGHRPTRVFVAGMALALAGAITLMGESMALDPEHLKGDALGMTTAAFYAGYILSVSRLRARLPTVTIMAWSGLVTTLALLPVALLSGESLIPPTPRAWAVLFGLAVVSQVAGQSLIAHALAHLPAGFGSVALLLQPAVAAVLAWALLAEPLSLWQAAGG